MLSRKNNYISNSKFVTMSTRRMRTLICIELHFLVGQPINYTIRDN